MAKLTGTEKTERTLKFALGLRDRRIAAALMARGFAKADLQEGLALITNVTTVALSLLPNVTSDHSETIGKIDDWENEHFPVADATLSRHFPEVRAKLFLNLSQQEGPAVIISVGTFIKRLALLTKAEGGYGPQGKEARKLLSKRGITAEAVAKATALLEQIGTIEDIPEPPDLTEHLAAVEKAEAAMWAWYLEWSEIARATIKQRSLLRKLGFLTGSGKNTQPVEDVGTDEPTTPAAVTTNAPSTVPTNP